jgi:hypothetical protein
MNNQFDGLVNDVRRLNQARAARRQAESELRESRGQRALFLTMLQSLPAGHPLHDQDVRERVWSLGVEAFDDRREFDVDALDFYQLQEQLVKAHQMQVQKTFDQLTAAAAVERGVIFRHWTLQLGSVPVKLPGIKSQAEVEAIRERAIHHARSAPRGSAIHADIAIRRALSNS